MASQSVIASPAFLIFPATSPIFTWRVVALETNRTISRHKNLELAIEKAERLNALALQPLFVQCAHESQWGLNDGMQCKAVATVHHLASELEYCAEHFAEVSRG